MPHSANRAVLGINAYSHDAAAALFVDGRLVFAAEEERYDRVRHSAAFPRGAVLAALRHAGLAPSDVELVAFPWRRDMARLRKALYFASRLPRSLSFLLERPAGLPGRVEYLRSVARLEGDVQALGIRAPVRHVEHHLAHAAQAHLFGPADRAAILTMDGMGEWTSAAAWVAEGGTIRRLARQCYPHSLGKVYAAVTQHLGFVPDHDEGKTMGLAPYGRPALLDAFRALLRRDPKRLFRVDLGAFAYPFGRTRMGGVPFERRFGPPRAPSAPIEPRHEDLAFAAQRALEEIVLDIARRLRAESGADHLCLAGGLFLNCVLNGRLLREAGFGTVSLFPAAGDSGAAAGAAALASGAERQEASHAFWGDSFTAEECAAALEGLSPRRPPDPAEEAAATLARGGIVGWFSGRMEVGPRALGARSILADPRDPAMKERINRTVKFREDFRPFAPAVLEEEMGRWFEGARPSPFMLFTFPVLAGARARIPAVTHVDGSARVETVGQHHPLRPVLEAFARRTGVPLLLNTSLNVRGEPIVRTPGEAAALFRRTALDLLVLEGIAVSKPAAGNYNPAVG